MKKILFTLLVTFFTLTIAAQPTISFDTVVTGFSNLVDVVEVNDGSNRLFLVERTGLIFIWNGSRRVSTPFLNVTSKITSAFGEQGLLSLAFHPRYATNGYFYIYYTNTAGSITLARYSRQTDSTAYDTSGVVMLTIPKMYVNHNGGKLLFGTDSLLYFGTGDGGSGGDPQNNAQNNTSLLGKMLRIDVNNPVAPYYNIPPTNPFFGMSAFRNEIIANGLRNPWRWSFDRQTGDMWIGDVGESLWEEVSMVTAANTLNKNYGWRCYEGTHVYNASCSAQANNVYPVYDYPHNTTTGGYSVTGGYVYRGSEYPTFQGYYIFTDFSTGRIWLTKPDTAGGWNTTLLPNKRTHISAFGETSNGTLYATLFDGVLYKVVAGATLPVRLVSFSGKEAGNDFEMKWQVEFENRGDLYVIEKRATNEGPFTELTKIPVNADHAANSYSLKVPLQDQKTFYRLKILAANGSIHYSGILSAGGKKTRGLKAYVRGKSCLIQLPPGTTNIEVFDAVGRLWAKQKLNGITAQTNIELPASINGVIVIRALANKEWQAVKVVSANE